MILGITGLNCSGKDTVAEFLMKRGFKHFSLSDVIRDDLRKDNIELTRENIRLRGNKLRKEQGSGILAQQTVQKFKLGQELKEKYVVTSIRNPQEVRVLK